MSSEFNKAPFPYFGGKSTIAHKIWQYLGQPKHYIEPFFGSGAVLLLRPDYNPTVHIETVNDKDGFIANVWRALKDNPNEVAKWCDWPVNHVDLHARRNKLIANEDRLLQNLMNDDTWYDAKLAGYWIWAASCWIGGGLTKGANQDSICGRPDIAHRGKGVHTMTVRNNGIYDWFNQLSNRLRYVRVVCGDWKRVCGGNWQDIIGTVGIFFDPPYSSPDRSTVYHHDSYDIGKEVEDWCLKRGDKKTYRIVTAGYEGEYQKLIEANWTVEEWKAQGGYSNQGETQNDNRFKERLFISPHCITNQYKMF